MVNLLSQEAEHLAVSVADTIGLAEQSCEETISKINGPLFHRKDIGTQPLITKELKI